jgi:hypothetical protein
MTQQQQQQQQQQMPQQQKMQQQQQQQMQQMQQPPVGGGFNARGGPVMESTDVMGSTDPAAAEGSSGAGPGPVMEGKGGAEALATVFESQARVHDGADRPLHFERVVAWQEKIFSASEVEERKRRQPETELDRKYASMIRDAQLAGEAIYTHVDADAFADERDADRQVTTSPSEPFNGLFKAVFGTPGARNLAKNATGRDATRQRTDLARGRRRRSGAQPATFAICADCGPLQLPPDHPAFYGRDVGLYTLHAVDPELESTWLSL